ncbi:MAG: hypothetical protein GX575_22680 [Candidatus Anammoximicrobium sp.]|nr:hypothetical protein [Candidatus Anammoximicrobium sp.]
MDADQNATDQEITFEPFAAQKKTDRAELLALPPDEAQVAVEQVLYPPCDALGREIKLPLRAVLRRMSLFAHS